MKPKISVVISAFNEEKSIARCLSSVSFANECIVIDNQSSDKTASVAKSLGAKVYSKANLLMLNINKNYGFSKASGDWILNLDADEEIPVALAKEIIEIIRKNPKEVGFWIKRKNFSFGKWIRYGLWCPDRQIRLFRRNKGQFPCLHIHEYIKVDGEVGELREPYVHYNYETIHQYLMKIDRASSSEAIFLKDTQYQLSWYDAIRFPVSDFLKIYFAQQGYKDGLHGLVLALFQAFYSFSVFAKLWEMEGFTDREIKPGYAVKELEKNGKEMKFWLLSTKISETKNVILKMYWTMKRRWNRISS
jgi:glycosyltransferase involved in cell wall biosynthesis